VQSNTEYDGELSKDQPFVELYPPFEGFLRVYLALRTVLVLRRTVRATQVPRLSCLDVVFALMEAAS